MSLLTIAVAAILCCVFAVCLFAVAVWLLSRAEIDEARRISRIEPTRMDQLDGLDVFE